MIFFRRHLINGISLTELLLVIAICGVLLTSAFPSFKNQISQIQTRVSIKSFSTAIKLARSTAITQQQHVTFCKSSDGHECIGQWNEGAIVFTDANQDRKINGDDRLIHRIPGNQRIFIRWRVFQNRQYLQINPAGLPRFQNGNFTFCPLDRNPHQAEQLIVNNIGRLRRAIDSDLDGVVEKANGEPVNC